MAYNSDGYIMIDFTEVDFRRTNQTIDGLYKRCVDVIGTNKFILVINANGRTPLPATCSFTNNQYVIDTCIYMFAISSNDNLFIRRNDVPASDIIDDDSVSVDKTWSSNKIDTELDGKQDTLTPVSPVSINADNEISVDLSGKQDVLTAGDNISIVNNVISAKGIKSFTYKGNGNTTNNIVFSEIPEVILSIEGTISRTTYALLNNIHWNKTQAALTTVVTETTTSVACYGIGCSYDNDNKTLILTSDIAAKNFNLNNINYTVYYI